MVEGKSGEWVALHSISHTYSGTGRVLEDIQLRIGAGEFVSILGPSGCGKSTLLKLLAALESPTRGKIDFGLGASVLERGFVFQEPRLLPWRSVVENVGLPLELHKEPRGSIRKRAEEILTRVGLGDSLHKYPAQLSGGMKMRASVARALVFQPSLLLLDEPFAALDENSRQILQGDLRELWRAFNMTVIFVTHSISEAVFLSNRAIVLSPKPARIVSDLEIELPLKRGPEIRVEGQFTQVIKKVSQFLVPRGEV